MISTQLPVMTTLSLDYALKSFSVTNQSNPFYSNTRAESEIHLVGSEQDFAATIEEPSNSLKRNSYLATLLTK